MKSIAFVIDLTERLSNFKIMEEKLDKFSLNNLSGYCGQEIVEKVSDAR